MNKIRLGVDVIGNIESKSGDTILVFITSLLMEAL
jgi:hypothetical protein